MTSGELGVIRRVIFLCYLGVKWGDLGGENLVELG